MSASLNCSVPSLLLITVYLTNIVYFISFYFQYITRDMKRVSASTKCSIISSRLWTYSNSMHSSKDGEWIQDVLRAIISFNHCAVSDQLCTYSNSIHHFDIKMVSASKKCSGQSSSNHCAVSNKLCTYSNILFIACDMKIVSASKMCSGPLFLSITVLHLTKCVLFLILFVTLLI